MNTGTHYTRVYFFTGRVAHLVVSTFVSTTLCGKSSQIGGFYGTGSQDEIDKANSLPICDKCERVRAENT